MIYLLDFSDSNITLFSTLGDNSWQLEKKIPFEIAFESKDSNIKHYFAPYSSNLSSDSLVEFTNLAENFKEINDEGVAKYILQAFFDKMFENFKIQKPELVQRKLPQQIETPDIPKCHLYITLPFNWQAERKEYIREILKDYPRIIFKGFLNEIFCLIIYYLYLDENKEGLETLIMTKNKANLLIVDLRPINPKFIYLIYSEDEKEKRLAIKDVQYLDKENLTKDLCHHMDNLLRKEDINSAKQGFVIRCFGQSKESKEGLDRELREWQMKTPIFSEISVVNSDNVIIEGAKKAIDILNSPTQLDKMLAIKYDFVFGIQLDADRIFELIPNLHEDVVFPYERKKAFCVEGAPEGIRVNLYCGFSDRVDSGIRIASIQAKPPDGSLS
ncbi:hypothetical protein KKE26_06575, partial [bacterium]|nr:hypothetical protein [bacterium]